MPFPMIAGSPPPRRRVPMAYGPSYGLLDALDDPRLISVAEQSRPIGASGRPQDSGASPDEGAPEHSLARRYLLDPFIIAGKDLGVGVQLGNSGIYKTLANLVGLSNVLNDAVVRRTGYGWLSKDNYGQDVKDWLDATAVQVGPRPEDIPQGIIDNLYVSIGRAPADIAQYLVGGRLIGPIAGLAAVSALREADKGPEAAAKAAAEGAMFGAGAKALEPLNALARAVGLGGLGAGLSLADNGDPADAVASAVPLGLLGAIGVPRAEPPNLRPLEFAYNNFVDTANHAQSRLDVLRGLTQKRQQQLRVGINQVPGLSLEDVVRRSDELLGYKVGRGGTYKLPKLPYMLSRRTFDSTRSKRWWRKSHEVEVKRENAKSSRAQRLADAHLEKLGVIIKRRRENEILRRARIQLNKEGRFDADARRLGQAIGRLIDRGEDVE